MRNQRDKCGQPIRKEFSIMSCRVGATLRPPECPSRAREQNVSHRVQATLKLWLIAASRQVVNPFLRSPTSVCLSVFMTWNSCHSFGDPVGTVVGPLHGGNRLPASLVDRQGSAHRGWWWRRLRLHSHWVDRDKFPCASGPFIMMQWLLVVQSKLCDVLAHSFADDDPRSVPSLLGVYTVLRSVWDSEEGFGTRVSTVLHHLACTQNGSCVAHTSSPVRAGGHCQRAPPPLISRALGRLKPSPLPSAGAGLPALAFGCMVLSMIRWCCWNLTTPFFRSAHSHSRAVEPVHRDDSSVPLSLSNCRVRSFPLCVQPHAFTTSRPLQWQVWVSQRSVVEVASASVATGLLSHADWSDCCARPAAWWLVSARDTLGWISVVNFSLAVSTFSCIWHRSWTSVGCCSNNGPFCVGVVLTLVVTIATGTSSIVERMCTRLGLAVPCFVQPLISCSFLLLRPCKFQFQSASPWLLCEHHWLAAGALEKLPRLQPTSKLRCTSRCLDRAYSFCGMLIFVVL